MAYYSRKKPYLENMEFEGNELSIIHHPTGFIRKLNSANHLSGTQNGDTQGKIIISTQKIGDGRYTAIDQVPLLPGFEATAKDAFLAKISSTNTYPTFNAIVLINMGGSGKESRGFTGKTQGSVRKVFNSFVSRVFFSNTLKWLCDAIKGGESAKSRAEF